MELRKTAWSCASSTSKLARNLLDMVQNHRYGAMEGSADCEYSIDALHSLCVALVGLQGVQRAAGCRHYHHKHVCKCLIPPASVQQLVAC
jgi:hypothetical protein